MELGSKGQQGAPRIEPGLIWGMDFGPGRRLAVQSCNSPHEGMVRWLHLNLADFKTRSWIENCGELPPAVRRALLSNDSHQQAIVDVGSVVCVLHDLERDFDVHDTGRVGVLRVALTRNLIVSARAHPIGSADIARQRLIEKEAVIGPAQALELMVNAILENITRVIRSLSAEIEAAEDALVEDRYTPNSRQLLHIRRRLGQVHRMLVGTQGVFRRLEGDSDLGEDLKPAVERLAQLIEGIDGDAISVQGQLRVLRDEIDMQSNQRINQNLYLLSVMTALLLPTTLVTGIFGMNTGGLPLTGPGGTLLATLAAAGAAFATYIFLRRRGFFRNK